VSLELKPPRPTAPLPMQIPPSTVGSTIGQASTTARRSIETGQQVERTMPEYASLHPVAHTFSQQPATSANHMNAGPQRVVMAGGEQLAGMSNAPAQFVQVNMPHRQGAYQPDAKAEMSHRTTQQRVAPHEHSHGYQPQHTQRAQYPCPPLPSGIPIQQPRMAIQHPQTQPSQAEPSHHLGYIGSQRFYARSMEYSQENLLDSASPKESYRALKRNFKHLVYVGNLGIDLHIVTNYAPTFKENESYQEELRNLQRQLLKLSRDKNCMCLKRQLLASHPHLIFSSS
jgi:hypothetical protein